MKAEKIKYVKKKQNQQELEAVPLFFFFLNSGDD